MSEYNLKEDLIKVQLAIKQNNLEQALQIYEKINNQWDKYKENLNPEEVQALLNLVDYIENLLKEKNKKTIEIQKFLNLRKSYTRF
jgi:dihydrodipicolinate synthase/N-acetylneuraminate lyase